MKQSFNVNVEKCEKQKHKNKQTKENETFLKLLCEKRQK
jgi:hypothetical protein